MSRRSFLRFSAITATGALIAACAPVATSPTGGEAGGSAPAAPTTVTYWNYMTDQEAVESPILAAFNEATADTTATFEYVPWQQYWQKLNATLAAGNPPDVWNTAPTFYYEYILRDQLLDLTDMVERDIDMENFHETALSGYDFNDKIYGIPRNIVTAAVFFNKSLFEEAGVEPPPLDGTWTWDDMLEMALALTQDADGDGRTDVWGTQALQSSWWLDPIIMANGGDIFKGEFRRDLVGMEANYDSEIACNTYKYFVDLINLHQVSYPAGEFEGMGSPFMTGRVAMVWDLNWGTLTFKEAPFDWDVTLAPRGAVEQLTYGGADGLVVSRASQNVEGAWQLISWLIDPATGGAFLTETGAMPVLKDEAVTDAYRQTFPDKNMNAFVQSGAIARNTFTLGYSEWKSALTTELEQSFLGQKPVEQMCQDANMAVNAAIERIRSDFEQATGG